MADNGIAVTSAIETMDDTVSHQEAAAHTGENTPTAEIHQSRKKNCTRSTDVSTRSGRAMGKPPLHKRPWVPSNEEGPKIYLLPSSKEGEI